MTRLESFYSRVVTVAHKAATWRAAHFPERFFAPVLAVVVGVLAGAAAALLKLMIGGVTKLLTHGLSAAHANWLFLVIPVAGILLTGIFVRYVVRIDITHGVDKLIAGLKRGVAAIKARIMVSPMLASAITLGFGGSAGSEGPIAYTGAAIGSNFGRLFGLSQPTVIVMVGCGAAAGIAGIFKAPVGGFLFALEVLRLELTTMSVLTVLAASISAAMTAFALSGCTLDVAVAGYHPLDTGLIPLFLALGVFCGFYSLYYSWVMKHMKGVYDRIANPWLKNLSGGVILAVCVFLFPCLYGEGYAVIGHLLAGDTGSISAGSPWHDASGPWAFIAIAAGIVLLKSFAASASNSAGGVAGDFAPTLFAGSIAGLLFAMTLNALFPDSGVPVFDFVFVAMGGVMAGAIRAPLMALFLIVEMTGCYTLFLPAFLVCGISFGIVRLFNTDDYYNRSKRIFSKFT